MGEEREEEFSLSRCCVIIPLIFRAFIGYILLLFFFVVVVFFHKASKCVWQASEHQLYQSEFTLTRFSCPACGWMVNVCSSP